MIKAASPFDAIAVAELAHLLWPRHPAPELLAEIEEGLQDENLLFALLYKDGPPIGFAQCSLRHDYVEGAAGSSVGYLEGIYVKEAFRNRGCAKRLLMYCEQWAKSKGCSEFASDCELDNETSFRFHLNTGFQEANKIICFIKKL